MGDFRNAFQAAHEPVFVTLLIFAVNFVQKLEIVLYSLHSSHDQFELPINNQRPTLNINEPVG